MSPPPEYQGEHCMFNNDGVTCTAVPAVGDKYEGSCFYCGYPFCPDHKYLHRCDADEKVETDRSDAEVGLPKPQEQVYSDLRLAQEAAMVAQLAESAPLLEAFALTTRPSAHSAHIQLPVLAPVEEDSTFKLWDWKRGGFNAHCPILFDSGEQVLVRLRAPTFRFRLSDTLTRLYGLSDYATVKTLHRMAPEFIPNAWRMEAGSWPLADTSFFMDCARGSSARHLWGKDYDETKYRTTLRDLASLYIALSSRSFEGVGSLYPSTETLHSESLEVHVGPLLLYENHFRSSPPLGPFRTNREAKTAKIDWLLRLIEEHKLGWLKEQVYHPPRRLLEPRPVLAYLTLLEARALVQECEEMGCSGPTYIRHGDENSGCILTLEDGSLSAVVDWEFAYTCPLEEAFIMPTFLLRYGRDWRSNEQGGVYQIFIDEFESRGRHDLARAIRGGVKYTRLNELLWAGARLSFITLDGLLGLEESFTGTLVDPPETLEDWEARARHRHRDNEKLQKVEADWKDHLADFEAAKVAEEVQNAKAATEVEANKAAEGSPSAGASSTPGVE